MKLVYHGASRAWPPVHREPRPDLQFALTMRTVGKAERKQHRASHGVGNPTFGHQVNSPRRGPEQMLILTVGLAS